MTSATDHPFQSEIDAALDDFRKGIIPLGKLIARFKEINKRAMLASYREGKNLRECAALHGVSQGTVADVIHQYAPGEIRPSGRHKTTRETQ